MVERDVEYVELERENGVRRRVAYENIRVHRDVGVENRAVERRPGNATIERNINTRDPRLENYRGRDDQRRPDPAARPAAAARAEPAPRPGPHAYGGKTESHFDPGAASRRGQASRQAAQAPPPPARAPPAARAAA